MSIIPGLPQVTEPTTVRIQVTPQMAKAWLAHNTHNRPLSSTAVDKHVADMRDGRWNENNPTPIMFSASGVLLDGQHRLTAQVRANATLSWFVTVGLPEDVQEVVDTGHTRTAGNILSLRGVPQPNICAAAARLSLDSRGVAKPSNLQIAEEIDSDLSGYAEAARVGDRTRKALGGSGSVYAYVFYRCARINEEQAGEFFARLQDGVGLPAGSPILAARTVMMRGDSVNQRTNTRAKAWALFHAWNLWRARKPLRQLKTPKSPVVPR